MMTNDELLQLYISRLDQDQAMMRQDQVALRRAMHEVETRIDRRADSLQASIRELSAAVKSELSDVRRELKEHKRFMVGTIVAAVGVAATTIIGLVIR